MTMVTGGRAKMEGEEVGEGEENVGGRLRETVGRGG
jgi:hypothetical protein